MKILYFLAHPERIGGAAKVILTQAHIMQLRGHIVRVVIQNDILDNHIRDYDELCNRMGLNSVSAYYPITTCMEEIDICSCYECLESIGKIIDDFQPDIIHSVQLNITVELASRIRSIPHLMNIYPLTEGMFQIEWKDCYPHFHCADSEYYSKKWRDGLCIDSRCIRVAYDRVKALSDNRQHNIEIVNIAVFAEYKHQLEIIKFLSICLKKGLDCRITFVGENRTKYGEICEKYVNNHNLQNYVNFVGVTECVERYLDGCDVMIHASTVESFPGVIIEAIANHVPVLTTAVGGISELIKDGKNGIIIGGFSEDSIWEAFQKYLLMREQGTLTELKSQGYSTYINNNTYDVVGNQLEQYYSDIRNKCFFKKIINQSLNIVYDVRNFFSEKKLNNYSEFTQKRVWYIYHIKEQLDRQKYESALIWGAGKLGKIALEWIEILNLKLFGFIDSFKNGLYEHYQIYDAKSEIISKADVIFIALSDRNSIQELMGFMERQGRVRNSTYYLLQNDPCLIPYDVTKI